MRSPHQLARRLRRWQPNLRDGRQPPTFPLVPRSIGGTYGQPIPHSPSGPATGRCILRRRCTGRTLGRQDGLLRHRHFVVARACCARPACRHVHILAAVSDTRQRARLRRLNTRLSRKIQPIAATADALVRGECYPRLANYSRFTRPPLFLARLRAARGGLMSVCASLPTTAEPRTTPARLAR